jgi:hypothetical protein
MGSPAPPPALSSQSPGTDEPPAPAHPAPSPANASCAQSAPHQSRSPPSTPSLHRRDRQPTQRIRPAAATPIVNLSTPDHGTQPECAFAQEPRSGIHARCRRLFHVGPTLSWMQSPPQRPHPHPNITQASPSILYALPSTLCFIPHHPLHVSPISARDLHPKAKGPSIAQASLSLSSTLYPCPTSPSPAASSRQSPPATSPRGSPQPSSPPSCSRPCPRRQR